ncbi:carbonic anhydrase family protein [Aequorivita sp. SDUM287046]|uniref:carbonic anhydrase n=1 Tax=Aequorivita aurantiaca TaxID=3053356 RepID=A0ABT8DHT9_9FLAO|nr:carbonic anhydrase family protein [Aequorivita aurantiaca]MDN3723559.1 carbonic anhydrase family protein [Aequorivita aurantiaca]
MKKLGALAILFAMVFIVSCKDEKKTENEGETTEVVVEETTEKPKHWGYDGESSPEHWAEIEKESTCGGSHQSPIDIVTANVVSQASGLKASDIHYDASTLIHDVTNNGHSIQYNFEAKDNYVDFKGKRYDLVQFHFHAASEHSINGMHYPLVVHLVHVSSDKEYVVLAIMVEEGKESKTFDFIETYLPVQAGETKTIGQPHSFSKYILGNFEHYYYKGSLTTPPCTEGVNWFIFTEPLSISAAQAKAIADLMPRYNYRPTQPLNDRKVYLSK